MKIIEPSAKLIAPYDLSSGITILRLIEGMARISHRSEKDQAEESWARFLEFVLLQKGDWSVAEHGHASVVYRVDRGVAIELRTHRYLFADMESAYTQESTRFVRYGGKQVPELDFIKPEKLITGLTTFDGACQDAEERYNMLLLLGERPQEARSVLPNALAATIGVTANLRAWRNFFLMRTTQEAHPDFKRVSIPLLAVFKERIPVLFEDIEPNARQIDNLRKPR